MSTMSFRDAMTGFSDVLYARAMENVADRRNHLLGVPGSRANAHAAMSFNVTLGKGGLANLTVSRYCAGFTLQCHAWIQSPELSTALAGHLHSSDGGGIEFSSLGPGQRFEFELKTSVWRSTTFTMHLRTTPALPEGTVLKVHMEIDY